MSDNPLDPQPHVGSLKDLMIWGAIVFSLVNGIAFSVALILAFVKGDQNNLNLLIGAVIAGFSNVGAFWLNRSSDASATRAALQLRALPPVPPASPPLQPQGPQHLQGDRP
jgi:hypothetical protein